MAVAISIEIPGGTQAQYDAVMAEVGNHLPASLLAHVAGPKEDGWMIVDVWESREAFDTFFKDHLQRALQNAKVPPMQPTAFLVHGIAGIKVPAAK